VARAGAAVESISKWRYETARRDGIPVDAYFTIIVSGELRGNSRGSLLIQFLFFRLLLIRDR
jgi:hypothetical protein